LAPELPISVSLTCISLVDINELDPTNRFANE
jgi:hypothetical protein